MTQVGVGIFGNAISHFHRLFVYGAFHFAAIDERLIWIAGGSIALIILLFPVRAISRAGRPGPELERPRLGGPTGEAESWPFAQEIRRSADEQGLPPSPLRAVVAKLQDAGIPNVEIAGRLQGAAEELARLRASLMQPRAAWPDQAPTRLEVLDLIDRGELEAASAALEEGCVGKKSPPGDGRFEEAAIYAEAAAARRLQLDYRAAAEKYAAAAELVAPALPDEASAEDGVGREEICHQNALAQNGLAQEIAAQVVLPQGLLAQNRQPSDGAGQNIGDRGDMDRKRERRSGDAKAEWRFRMDQARALSCDGRDFDNGQSFLEAIEVYEGALGLVPRSCAPDEWAATHFHLGGALLASGERDKDLARLEQAVDAYLAALEEWTREKSPLNWARAQNNLGDALQLLNAAGAEGDFLTQATEAYRGALQEWTRKSAPTLWAAAQGNLADALAVMGARENDKTRLWEAVAAYRAALEETPRAEAPLDWALLQNNLGNALQTLGERGTDRLRLAVKAYRAALEERTRKCAAASFATTCGSLASALLTIGERDGLLEVLREVASCYRDALSESAKQADSLESARIQINLAYALGAIWNRTQDPLLMEEAISMLEAAIGAFKRAGEAQQLPEAEGARQALLSAMGRAA